MSASKVFIYAEYQVSIPFNQIDWKSINIEMKKFPGLKSKTWLSGINTNTVGGFYEFDSVENAQNYINKLSRHAGSKTLSNYLSLSPSLPHSLPLY